VTVARVVLFSSVLALTACEDSGDRGTSGPGTSAASAGATSAAGGDTGASDTTSANESDSGATTTPIANACESVDECRLVNDCCTCEAIHRDETPAECPADCERPQCDVWGISEMLCSHTCLIRLVECDAAMVTCADPPPACEDGFMPSLEERCWSGHCVPVELCRPT
jgi:hypothetical protein